MEKKRDEWLLSLLRKAGVDVMALADAAIGLQLGAGVSPARVLARAVAAEGDVRTFLEGHGWTLRERLPEVLGEVPSALEAPSVRTLLAELRALAGPLEFPVRRPSGMTASVVRTAGPSRDVPPLLRPLAQHAEERARVLRRIARALTAPTKYDLHEIEKKVAARVTAAVRAVRAAAPRGAKDEAEEAAFRQEAVRLGFKRGSAEALRSAMKRTTRRNRGANRNPDLTLDPPSARPDSRAHERERATHDERSRAVPRDQARNPQGVADVRQGPGVRPDRRGAVGPGRVPPGRPRGVDRVESLPEHRRREREETGRGKRGLKRRTPCDGKPP